MIDSHTRRLTFVALFAFIAAAGIFFILGNMANAGRPAFSLMYPDGSGELGYGAVPALSHPDFFAEVKGKLLESGETFVEADLSAMMMRVYEKGTVSLEVPIRTKGKEGSWWETPAGLYQIETKEKDHFSTFGNVHQPWSMSFQGNFFIHGWPYYPDGTAVSSTFSGGCIRLSDENAKAVYDKVSVGTPVLVFEKDFASDGFAYEALPPSLGARGYLIGDVNGNNILLEKGEGETFASGSLTKLMTALIAGEYINMDKDATLKDTADEEGKEQSALIPGTAYKAFHLLYPLLLADSDRVAHTYASVKGEGAFISFMNKKAVSLGMVGSRFVDVTGDDEGSVTTVRDMFALARYVYHNRSFAFDITAGKERGATYGASPFASLENNIVGAEDANFLGGMSGVAPDGTDVALALFSLTHKGMKRPVAFVVYGSSDAERDITALRAYMARVYPE